MYLDKPMKAMSAPKVELRETSGMVSVRIVATRQWFIALIADVAIFYALYRYWQELAYWWKVLLFGSMAIGFFSTLNELLGEEVVEFDSQKLTVRKGIHGWERKREYDIAKCYELKWAPGHKGNSYMTCKVGWPANADGLASQMYYFAGRHTVKFGNR
jgi:hypothetical protein